MLREKEKKGTNSKIVKNTERINKSEANLLDCAFYKAIISRTMRFKYTI